eukprot:scaffold272576_cov28-Tisochrysis_lutea.AAC.1
MIIFLACMCTSHVTGAHAHATRREAPQKRDTGRQPMCEERSNKGRQTKRPLLPAWPFIARHEVHAYAVCLPRPSKVQCATLRDVHAKCGPRDC